MSEQPLLAQLYRGQLSHADTWRQRLDETTNWAVMLTAALLTWIFSSPSNPHYVLLVGMVATTMFLVIEARRYRQYDVWRYRVRMLEEHMFTAELDGEEDDGGWRQDLSDDLRQATVKIPFAEALIRRLRRVHGAILTVLLMAWVFKVIVFPERGTAPLDAMSIAAIPGIVVATAVVLFAAAALTLSLWPLERHAKGEIEETDEFNYKHD